MKQSKKSRGTKNVEKGNKDTTFKYHIARVSEAETLGDEDVVSNDDFVIGVRPKFIRLSDHGVLEGEIYSAMPTGMETTVKIKIGDFLLTGVVFGGVLYQIGQKVRLDFGGDAIVLFSRKNGKMITLGTLKIK